VVTSLAALAALVVLYFAHRNELDAALAKVPLGALALATALHLLTLVLRAEAWRTTVAAISGPPVRRPLIHTAAAGGFVGGALETHLALPMRVALLRRLAAREAPPMRKLLLSDFPLMALEGLCAALLLPVAETVMPGAPRWTALVAVFAGPLGVLGLRLLQERLAHRPLAAGLAILGFQGLRRSLACLALLIVSATLVRLWLLLWAAGLSHDPAHVAVAYVATSVLGLLPIGPASSVAGAVVAAGGASAAAGAAGFAFSASSLLAVAVYALAMGMWQRGGVLPRTSTAAMRGARGEGG
jgi:uncharacterized membrane protein YbhN (UPF0104 family)